MNTCYSTKSTNATRTVAGVPASRPMVPTYQNTPVISRTVQQVQPKGNPCACGGGCPKCRTEQGIQPKLRIGAPDDKYEQEADRVADQVMHSKGTSFGARMPEEGSRRQSPHQQNETPGARTAPAPVTPLVQRREDDSSEEMEEEEETEELRTKSLAGAVSPLIQRQESAGREDEEEKLIQTKTAGSATPADTTEMHSGIQSLQGNGRPLPESSRAFFEPRFGHDFGSVRIHADPRAAKLARSINARAFTLGQHIYFADGQNRPDTEAGRHLLAHELVHTIQQRSRLNSDRVQRVVSPDMDTIRDNLATSFWSFDWWVSDEEAHRVLVILNGLNAADLRDTVAVMEDEGLVDKLFDNVSDDDQADFEDLLQRIQDVRVHTGPHGSRVVHSCTPARLQDVRENIADTRDWARLCREAVADFISDPAAHGETGTRLDRFFFHQAQNRTLSEPEQIHYAEQIRDNFEDVEQQNNPFDIACASPFDSQCGTAVAYVDSSAHRVVFCGRFFDYGETSQTAMLFHEFTHAYGNVEDTGYSSERIFIYLTPQDAVNNADSYELFARDTVPGAGGAAGQLRSLQDSYEDCDPVQVEGMRRDIAIGERMIYNALNVIQDPDITGSGAGQTQVETHFQTSDRSELARVVRRYRDVETELDGIIRFECEEECDGELGYYYRLGRTVHVCPDFFSIASEDRRADMLLTMVIMEREGMEEGASPESPTYAMQSADQAYDNPESYVAYAREISGTYQQWNYLNAAFRYSRDIRESFEREAGRLLEGITETDIYRTRIRSRYVNPLRQALDDELNRSPPINRQTADAIRENYLERLRNLMQLAQRTSDEYFHFAVEVDVRELLVDPGLQDAYRHLTRGLKLQMQRDLLDELEPWATLIIDPGTHIAAEPWPGLEALRQRYDRALRASGSYLPLYRRSMEVEQELTGFIERRRTRLSGERQVAFEEQALEREFELIEEMGDLQAEIRQRLLRGEAFSEEAGLTDPDAVLRRLIRELRRLR